MLASIVVVPRERFTSLPVSLRSLFSTIAEEVPVVVVEGGTPEATRGGARCAVAGAAIPAHLAAVIHVLRTPEVGDIRANGKLAGLARETTPCTFFSVDDDVEYPADYCDTLETYLAEYGGRAAVGVHAAILSSPVASYVGDMTVMHRRAALDDATEADLLGTDSTAFRTSTLYFDVREWEHVNLVDLSFALAARRESVPLVAIPRTKGWVNPLAERQPDSIWLGVRRDDTKQTALAQELVALPRPRLAPPEIAGAGISLERT